MILSGIEVSTHIKSELKKEVSNLNIAGKKPLLAPILVGNDPASMTYVSNVIINLKGTFLRQI